MAAGKLSADDVKELIPTTFPITHTVPDFPCIARYPVDQWATTGAPCFSTQSWYKLAMRIAHHDMDNLGKIFDFAKALKRLSVRVLH